MIPVVFENMLLVNNMNRQSMLSYKLETAIFQNFLRWNVINPCGSY